MFIPSTPSVWVLPTPQQNQCENLLMSPTKVLWRAWSIDTSWDNLLMLYWDNRCWCSMPTARPWQGTSRDFARIFMGHCFLVWLFLPPPMESSFGRRLRTLTEGVEGINIGLYWKHCNHILISITIGALVYALLLMVAILMNCGYALAVYS